MMTYKQLKNFLDHMSAEELSEPIKISLPCGPSDSGDTHIYNCFGLDSNYTLEADDREQY